jgi:hypothetical protein
MSTRTLTLSADESLVQKLEQIAAARSTDLNSMITRALEVLAQIDIPLDPATLPPNTRAAYGLLNGVPPDDRPYKEILTEALMEKYGLDK